MNNNIYQSLFNKDTGRIYTSFVKYVHYNNDDELQALANKIKEEALKENINLELVKITQEEWEYYTGNKDKGNNKTGYIIDFNIKKPIFAPPLPPPTEEELKKQKLNALQVEYDNQCDSFIDDLSIATLADNQEAIVSLQAEFKDFQKTYKDTRAQIMANVLILINNNDDIMETYNLPFFTRIKRCEFCKSELIHDKCSNINCINYNI